MKIRMRSRWLLLWVLALPWAAHAQSYSRTEVITYHDDHNLWVMGQVASVTCISAIPASTSCDGNDVISQTVYGWKALPGYTYAFDKLQQAFTYNDAVGPETGTLKTVTDGRNNTTVLSNWKRGIPQLIQYPATPDQPSGVSQSAWINNNGEIDWITDENGYKTCYAYDAMGRLASIVYPTGGVEPGVCDSSRWNPRQIEFRPLTAGDWRPTGVLPGQWRQVIAQGHYRKVTYFDALWRPVLMHEVDETNNPGTLSSVRTEYDSSGRVSFQSYPSREVIPPSVGTWTFYDALDRVTRVEQDSERGRLVTTTEYLPNVFWTRVTNPNQRVTDTSYMAYDQPTYEWPVGINHPEGVDMEIYRDPFGKPTAIRRRSRDYSADAWRHYVYDGNQQLCKSIEPETHATVFDYDAAGNLNWSAAGLGLPSGTDCNRTEALGSGRVVNRSYDQRNRLKTLNFPDTRGDQNWFYTPDGLPSKVVTVNVPGAVHPENHYAYNKRRLLTTETQHLPAWYSYSLGYGYDANGSLKRIHYPSSDYVDFAPNALGQATEARNSAGHAYAYGATYHANGTLAGFTYGNGVAYTMLQNDRQLPWQTNSQGVQRYEIHYDGNANPTAIFDQTRGGIGGNDYTRELHYDGLDRLKAAGSASFGGSHWHDFTYDALDNLVTWKHGGVKDHRYCYNAANRLEFVRSGATTCSNGAAADYFQYDVQGNVEIHDGTAFDFDYGNRLREVIGVERYRYDAYGRRVLAMSFGSGVILSQYGHNGQLLYQKNDRTGQNKQIDHIYLAGSLIAQREQSLVPNSPVTVKYLHTDALGSPVAVTNQAGQVTERMEYEPYGKQMATTASIGQDRPGYTGHVRDAATSMLYAQQRYLHQDHPVFLSVDPVTALSSPVGQFNRYRYANNNPYRFTDPDGRFGLEPNLFVPANQTDFGATAEGVAGLTPVGDIQSVAEAFQNPTFANIAAAVVGLAGPVGDVVAKGIKVADKAADAGKASKVEKSVKTEKVGRFTKTTEVRPGKGPGQSRAEYVRVKNQDGKTIRTHKDSYDRAGNFQGRKPLTGGPEGRPVPPPPPPTDPRRVGP